MKKTFTAKRYFLLIILFHTLWFFGALIWQHIDNDDAREYFFLARNLSQGLYYSADAALPINPFFISLRTPIYSIFILVIETIFGKNDWVILFFQNIISIANCYLVFKIFSPLKLNA